jgi:hypothetical protein
MKKIMPHILFFLLTITAYSQGVFFNLGKNFSTFQYKNKSAFTDKLAIKGFGDASDFWWSSNIAMWRGTYLKCNASTCDRCWKGKSVVWD